MCGAADRVADLDARRAHAEAGAAHLHDPIHRSSNGALLVDQSPQIVFMEWFSDRLNLQEAKDSIGRQIRTAFQAIDARPGVEEFRREHYGLAVAPHERDGRHAGRANIVDAEEAS